MHEMMTNKSETHLGPISLEAKEVRGPIPDKAYTVPMKTSLALLMVISAINVFVKHTSIIIDVCFARLFCLSQHFEYQIMAQFSH